MHRVRYTTILTFIFETSTKPKLVWTDNVFTVYSLVNESNNLSQADTYHWVNNELLQRKDAGIP